MIRFESLRSISDANLCSGCGICESLAGSDCVEMQVDFEGFYRPHIHQPIPDNIWGIIQQVCPGIILEQNVNDTNSKHAIWGTFIDQWVGYAVAEDVRWKAASGGALSAISTYLLNADVVDYVIQIGVDVDAPFLLTTHLSSTREEIIECAGSRYAPTTLLKNFIQLLTEDTRKFAVIGKPCEIAAVRSYLTLNPQYSERVVVLLSFFCAGVPSLYATHQLVDTLGIKREEVKSFRYRGFGWPGRTTAITCSGQKYSMSYRESWGGILGKRLQFRCKICPDGIGEFADIVCGDAWITKDGSPDFEEHPGKSLIFARTVTGFDLINSAAHSGHLILEPFAGFEMLALMQPYQRRRRQAIIPRLLALQLAGRPIPRYRGFALWRSALAAGPIFFIKQFIGMLSRVLRRSGN